MFTRKPPKYSDFKLEEPPGGLRHVLYLNPRDPFEPLAFRIIGAGQAWITGWFVLRLPDSGIPRGIDFLLNGKRVQRLVPDDVEEISGCIGCNTRGFAPQAEDFLELAQKQVSTWLAERLHSWIIREAEAQVYQQTVQRLFIASATMRRFLSDDPARREAVRRLHVFETNHGGRTLNQLLNEAKPDSYIKATLALDPRHHLLESRFAQELIVGLRDSGSRTFFDRIAADLPLSVEFVDPASCWFQDDRGYPGEGHSGLREWFLKGLRGPGRPRGPEGLSGVQVAFWPAERCNYFAALLLPPAKRDFPENINSDEWDRSWTRHATLVVNVQSDLFTEIAELARNPDSRAFQHLPVAIHNLAALLAMANFSPTHQHYLWLRISQLLAGFRETEDQIRGLMDRLEQHDGDADRISALTEEVALLKKELKLRETELDWTKQQLELLLQATGRQMDGWRRPEGASV